MNDRNDAGESIEELGIYIIFRFSIDITLYLQFILLLYEDQAGRSMGKIIYTHFPKDR